MRTLVAPLLLLVAAAGLTFCQAFLTRQPHYTMALQLPSLTRQRGKVRPPQPTSGRSTSTSPLFSSPSTIPAPDRPPPPPPKRRESAAHFAHWFTTQAFLMPEIRPVTFLNMACTALIAVAYNRGMVGAIDINPHSLLAGPLGFFLTFRAQKGFDRCEEARKVWDRVLDTSRDMARCAIGAESLLGRSGRPFPARRLMDLTCAYGVLLEEFVTQKQRQLELEALLEERDLEALQRGATNRPLALTELISEEVVYLAKTYAPFRDSPYFGRLLEHIDQLSHHITQVQRLMKPPVPPFFYTHALRFLTLYVLTLPFALLDKLPGRALVPAVGIVTWALFGLRELGIKAQYPFSSGLVDLRTLWKEVIYDARVCLEETHQKAEKEREGEEGNGREREEAVSGDKTL